MTDETVKPDDEEPDPTIEPPAEEPTPEDEPAEEKEPAVALAHG